MARLALKSEPSAIRYYNINYVPRYNQNSYVQTHLKNYQPGSEEMREEMSTNNVGHVNTKLINIDLIIYFLSKTGLHQKALACTRVLSSGVAPVISFLVRAIYIQLYVREELRLPGQWIINTLFVISNI